jgi:hypothetical protein
MSKSQKPRRKYDPARWINRAVTANEQRMDAKPLAIDRQTDIALGHHLSFEGNHGA